MMDWLLWTLVVFGVVNTLAVFWQAARGSFYPITMKERVVDWVLTAGMGGWALWLLATQQ